MITIDISELKSERDNLSNFLKLKLRASIIVRDRSLVINSEEVLSSRDVKAFVKRFLHHRGLSEIYRVIEEKKLSELLYEKLWENERLRRREQNLHRMTRCLISFQIVPS